MCIIEDGDSWNGSVVGGEEEVDEFGDWDFDEVRVGSNYSFFCLCVNVLVMIIIMFICYC